MVIPCLYLFRFSFCTAYYKKPQTDWSRDVVDGTGLEPVTSCTSSRCSTS